jgi:hypothetical protein
MIVEPNQCLFRNNFDDDSMTFPSVARVFDTQANASTLRDSNHA